VPSNYFKNVIKEKYNVKSNKIIIYPSGGVDVNKFKKINKKTALKNASLKDDIKYFGYVSRIEKDKGYDTLVLAINELKKQKKLKGIKFLIIGSGREDNTLDKLIEEYKLKKYIERRPFATQDELVNIYNSLVALIYPTRRKSESLGLTGLEALASEALVIGSNKYGPSDYLIDNENSITFNPEDYQELAKKIEGTLKLKAKERNRLTKNGREKALEYSLENTKDNLLNVFKK
jgi:glycosyltransferase involved in cell wall biosynthesis